MDSPTTFIIGDGSDLKVAKVENTAAAIGTTENGKLSIDEYVGYNLENVDKLKNSRWFSRSINFWNNKSRSKLF